MSGLQAVVFAGKAENLLPGFLDGYADAVVTDPPYALSFMGKDWDSFGDGAGYQVWCQVWAAECLRILKPGGHLLAFGGTRTYHRLACAIEDAGFEIRDSLHWLYGSGFPKNLDVSKAIDKAAGVEREVTGEGARFGRGSMRNRSRVEIGYRPTELNPEGGAVQVTAPATDDARRWEGWGTALKPAHEPIVLARKPFAGTVAASVLARGTGAINVGGCRVAHASAADRAESENKNRHADFGSGPRQNNVLGDMSQHDRGWQGNYDDGAGRWPPNVLLTHDAECNGQCVPGCPVAVLDRQSGTSKSPSGVVTGGRNSGGIVGTVVPGARRESVSGHGDEGGASRFFPVTSWKPETDDLFRYQAKAPASERPRLPDGTQHPTCKPLALMRWLVRLVTPPDGLVLDPFAGTGTTVQAALLEGFRVVGIDSWPAAIELARIRLASCEEVVFA